MCQSTSTSKGWQNSEHYIQGAPMNTGTPIFKIHKVQHFVTIWQHSLSEIFNFHEQNHFIDCLCLWRKMIKTKWPVSTYYSICRANLCNRSLINTLWAFLITLVYKNKNNRNANTCISLNRSTPSHFNPQLPSGSVHPYYWTSQFPVLGVSDVLFHFYSISNIYSC